MCPHISVVDHPQLASSDTAEDTPMTDESRTALDEIRVRDRALQQVASRSEAEAALNDCRTLLAIIDELQTDVLNSGRPAVQTQR
jgi:hypothetical protein